MSFQIAIDGPAGSGKSTVAKKAARQLGFLYVDTGAMYRTIAFYMLENHVDVENAEDLRKALSRITIQIGYEDGRQQMILNGENVSGYIRTPEVSAQASRTASKPEVREKLLRLQRDLAEKNNVIMDGRDIGTVILPGAQLKVFMTAGSAQRAERRFRELQEKGEPCSLSEIQKDIEERDYRDTHRTQSPLVEAQDAVLLDTSDIDADQAAEKIVRLARERMGIDTN